MYYVLQNYWKYSSEVAMYMDKKPDSRSGKRSKAALQVLLPTIINYPAIRLSMQFQKKVQSAHITAITITQATDDSSVSPIKVSIIVLVPFPNQEKCVCITIATPRKGNVYNYWELHVTKMPKCLNSDPKPN